MRQVRISSWPKKNTCFFDLPGGKKGAGEKRIGGSEKTAFASEVLPVCLSSVQSIQQVQVPY
jgi:hypothetical protein